MKSVFKLIATLACALAVTACGGGSSNDKAVTPVVSQPVFTKTDTAVGTGIEATDGDLVTVHYTGWLYDSAASATGYKGTQFDSSRGSTPFSFTLGRGTVIPGWDQGLLGMKAGGKRTLIIPASLAYGAQASAKIPANSPLVFEVEMLVVKR